MNNKTAEQVRKEIAAGGYSGKIPTAGLTALEWELTGLVHGKAILEVHIRDGKLARFTTARERSFVPAPEREGAA
jgi:hypothetical protein